MPQLVARIDASGEDIFLTLMPAGNKEATGSEKLLASRLVTAARADASIPLTGIAGSTSSKSDTAKN